jgi:hypothetical protein
VILLPSLQDGAVFRLSPEKLDLDDIERRLAEADPKGLPSIIEARAQAEIDREESAERCAADNPDQSIEFSVQRY